MKKFVFLFSIISFCILSGFISPDVVFASDFTPVYNPGSLSASITNQTGSYNMELFSNGSFGVYYLYEQINEWVVIDKNYRFSCVFFDIDKQPDYLFSFNDSYSSNTGSYTKEFNGVVHTVYYTYFGDCVFTERYNLDGTPQYNMSWDITGTRVYNLGEVAIKNDTVARNVINFFLFGEGNYDFDSPSIDIPDSDLDIVGLSAYILNDQTGSIDWEETCKNTFMNFLNASIRAFFDVNYDNFDLLVSDSHILEGSIVNYVPGVALAWNAPLLDSDISYSVWVDGISKINYKTSWDPINDYRNTQNISSCSYSKLQINDSPLVQSGSVYYQYNTNQGLQTILEFIENNSSLNPPSSLHSWNRYSYVNLETTISRVYIQASKEIDGDRHYGAISYVDIVDGQPIVHEGVTDSITDITPSDPETSGTTTTVGTPMTTSGNTIYTGDTITNNNEYNYNYGTGLIVGTSNPLGFIKRLFSAIFELIQSLYLAFLVPFILLGMTGSTGGIL